MKRITLYLLIILLIFSPAAIAQSMQHVADQSGTFTQSQKDALEVKLQSIYDTFSFDVVIVTTNDSRGQSAQMYAADFYDDFRSYSAYPNGLIFTFNFDLREYYEATRGIAQSLFSDSGQADLDDLLRPFLNNKDYYGAMSSYADYISSRLSIASLANESSDVLPAPQINSTVRITNAPVQSAQGPIRMVKTCNDYGVEFDGYFYLLSGEYPYDISVLGRINQKSGQYERLGQVRNSYKNTRGDIGIDVRIVGFDNQGQVYLSSGHCFDPFDKENTCILTYATFTGEEELILIEGIAGNTVYFTPLEERALFRRDVNADSNNNIHLMEYSNLVEYSIRDGRLYLAQAAAAAAGQVNVYYTDLLENPDLLRNKDFIQLFSFDTGPILSFAPSPLLQVHLLEAEGDYSFWNVRINSTKVITGEGTSILCIVKTGQGKTEIAQLEVPALPNMASFDSVAGRLYFFDSGNSQIAFVDLPQRLSGAQLRVQHLPHTLRLDSSSDIAVVHSGYAYVEQGCVLTDRVSLENGRIESLR